MITGTELLWVLMLQIQVASCTDVGCKPWSIVKLERVQEQTYTEKKSCERQAAEVQREIDLALDQWEKDKATVLGRNHPRKHHTKRKATIMCWPEEQQPREKGD